MTAIQQSTVPGFLELGEGDMMDTDQDRKYGEDGEDIEIDLDGQSPYSGADDSMNEDVQSLNGHDIGDHLDNKDADMADDGQGHQEIDYDPVDNVEEQMDEPLDDLDLIDDEALEDAGDSGYNRDVVLVSTSPSRQTFYREDESLVDAYQNELQFAREFSEIAGEVAATLSTDNLGIHASDTNLTGTKSAPGSLAVLPQSQATELSKYSGYHNGEVVSLREAKTGSLKVSATSQQHPNRNEYGQARGSLESETNKAGSAPQELLETHEASDLAEKSDLAGADVTAGEVNNSYPGHETADASEFPETSSLALEIPNQMPQNFSANESLHQQQPHPEFANTDNTLRSHQQVFGTKESGAHHNSSTNQDPQDTVDDNDEINWNEEHAPESGNENSTPDGTGVHSPAYIHPVTIVYQDNHLLLFPPYEQDNGQSQTFFLEDESLAYENIDVLLEACRHVLAESIAAHDELEIYIQSLGLRISETTPEASTTSLAQILEIYLQLNLNDGLDSPHPLEITLSSKGRVSGRLELLYSAVAAGKGLQHILDSHQENVDDTEDLDDLHHTQGLDHVIDSGPKDPQNAESDQLLEASQALKEAFPRDVERESAKGSVSEVGHDLYYAVDNREDTDQIASHDVRSGAASLSLAEQAGEASSTDASLRFPGQSSNLQDQDENKNANPLEQDQNLFDSDSEDDYLFQGEGGVLSKEAKDTKEAKKAKEAELGFEVSAMTRDGSVLNDIPTANASSVGSATIRGDDIEPVANELQWLNAEGPEAHELFATDGHVQPAPNGNVSKTNSEFPSVTGARRDNTRDQADVDKLQLVPNGEGTGDELGQDNQETEEAVDNHRENSMKELDGDAELHNRMPAAAETISTSNPRFVDALGDPDAEDIDDDEINYDEDEDGSELLESPGSNASAQGQTYETYSIIPASLKRARPDEQGSSARPEESPGSKRQRPHFG